jgi:hypothetical protein
MKTLTPKIKYIMEGETAKLYARPKIGHQRFMHFANCHSASIPLLKEDFQKHRGLIVLTMKFYEGADGNIRKM